MSQHTRPHTLPLLCLSTHPTPSPPPQPTTGEEEGVGQAHQPCHLAAVSHQGARPGRPVQPGGGHADGQGGRTRTAQAAAGEGGVLLAALWVCLQGVGGGHAAEQQKGCRAQLLKTHCLADLRQAATNTICCCCVCPVTTPPPSKPRAPRAVCQTSCVWRWCSCCLLRRHPATLSCRNSQGHCMQQVGVRWRGVGGGKDFFGRAPGQTGRWVKHVV
jgi:hypothetical protein